MAKAKPVYQYDMYGRFIQEFPSIEEAARQVDGGGQNIRSVCQKKFTTSYGFQWRYKHEIHDRSKKIGLGKYNLDDDMKYLKEVWYSICRRPFNPNDERYDPDLHVYPKWKDCFDNFYYDVVDNFEKFSMENTDYKKDLKKRHIWFGRIDKNKGWTPDNTEFMTPDFCVRHKDEVHKVIKEGRTLTAQMVVEELESMGIDVAVGTILKRMRENRGLTEPSQQAKYKFNGEYYSLLDLAEMLDFDYDYVKHRINKKGENLKQAIKSFKDYKPYSFKENKNLAKHEYAKLLANECGLKRRTIEYRIDAGWSEKEILETPIRGENT